MKSSIKQMNIGIAALALALASTLAQAADGRARDATGPRMAPQTRQAETEVIRLRAGQLPYVSLTADIFYRVLASEIAAQRGMYGTAATTMVGLARDTGDPRLARRALEFQLAGGNLPGALDAARVWARLSPNDLEASSTELALAAANGQTRGLSQALRNRIDASRDKPAAIGQALAVLSRLNDRRLALRILDESFSDGVRKLPAAHMALADVASAAGDDERAAQEARAALASDPKSEPAAQRVLEYGFKVDPQRAQTEARAYIARNPNARKVRLMLAGQLADSGDYNAALAELQSMSRRSPEDFDLLFMQAQLAYKAGQLQQARTLLQQYLDVQNQRQRATVPGATDAGAAAADAHVLLARIAEDQGRYDEAINELGRIEDPTLRFSVRMRQAALRAKEGRVDDALAMIDAAGPQDEEERTQGVLTKAQILRDADRVGQAVAVLEAADRDLPDTVEIKYELAMLYERQDRVADLERLLRQVIALDPDHAHAYNALGYTLADRNQRLPEALDLITQALELAPNDPFILDSMGWVKFRMGDQAAAAEYLRRAYSTRPEADIAAHLAEVLWSQGKRDQAVELLRGAKLKDPTNRALLDTIKRLGVAL
ncbi:tetratricopeptide repeat protein [Achromobacter sp. Marseille-Q0513]|nr:tetratricopeptide repeat protein [Achromobacter sp. Marseille-Q0513]